MRMIMGLAAPSAGSATIGGRRYRDLPVALDGGGRVAGRRGGARCTVTGRRTARACTAEHAGRVFDRFYRTDRSRTRSGGANAGLGLAIARSLARAHDGDVDVETALGEGACFRLTLPLLRQG
jgi:light-regulated signal transduction histidine kinase (bacteriophytochrome)